jgi:hypothetical protein
MSNYYLAQNRANESLAFPGGEEIPAIGVSGVRTGPIGPAVTTTSASLTASYGVGAATTPSPSVRTRSGTGS